MGQIAAHVKKNKTKQGIPKYREVHEKKRNIKAMQIAKTMN